MAAALYGPAHPYGYTELGTEASNKAMTRDDMQKFWTQNFVPNNAALIVSGQITVGGAAAAGREGVRRLAARHAGAADARRSRRRRGARCVLVDKPGAPQTQLRVASIGVPRATPDYEALRVMNETLGGLFSSRINLNLREAARLHLRRQLAVRVPPGGRPVPGGVRRAHRRHRAGGHRDLQGAAPDARHATLTPEELTLAKDSLVRSLPAEFETSGGVTASTANIYVYDLGLDYYTKLPARLSAVDGRAGEGRGGEVHRAGEAARHRGRRSREDRRASCRS